MGVKYTKKMIEKDLPDGIGVRYNAISAEWIVHYKKTNNTILAKKADEVDKWRNPSRVLASVVRRKLKERGQG